MTFWQRLTDATPMNDDLITVLLTRFGATVLLLFAIVLIGIFVNRVLSKRIEDNQIRYLARKITSYVLLTLAIVSMLFLWAPLGGRLSLFITLIAAGLALASQEAIGAFFGWISIVSGKVYTVGDRIMIQELRGEVIDITPLRTKVFEIGGDGQNNWISGRQYTGRVVTFSNKLTLHHPVYNYSSNFEYIWDEFSVIITYDSDWKKAKEILTNVVHNRIKEITAEGAVEVQQMGRRYPMAELDTGLKLFVAFNKRGIELNTRFLIGLEGARRIKSDITERLLEQFQEAGISIAYPTQHLYVRDDEGSGFMGKDKSDDE